MAETLIMLGLNCFNKILSLLLSGTQCSFLSLNELSTFHSKKNSPQ